MAPRDNPPNGHFFVFSRDELSPRHAKECSTFHASPCCLLLVVSLPGWAKGRHAKTRQMVTFSCIRMAIFHPATRKYATFHALRFRLLFVVSLPGGAKGRLAKTRQHHHLAGFRVATFRVFAPLIRHGTNQPPYMFDVYLQMTNK